MRKSLIALIVALMVTVAVLALVSVGVSHTQAIMINAGFMGSMGHHMGQDNHMDYDENTLSHMNVTQHMQGDMYNECAEIHSRMNMTDHASHMH